MTATDQGRLLKSKSVSAWSHRAYRLWMQPKRYRPAVPGAVWGPYPQANETEHPVVQRRRPLRSPSMVARRAQALASDKPIAVAHARWTLARDGLTDSSCALALACAIQHYAKSRGLNAHANQVHAATLLLDQQLVEMATGQGKTLTAALAAAVAALAGSAVHVLTANEYLAGRDAQTHQEFFASLGLQVASATDKMTLTQRGHAYQKAICYATTRTVAFDYLRDQTAGISGAQAEPGKAILRGLCFAIVDEADSILIDEASMPLVLSEAINDPLLEVDPYQAISLAGQLTPGVDFERRPAARTVRLMPCALDKLQTMYRLTQHNWLNQRYHQEIIIQALNALHIIEKDIDYVVQGEQIILVDKTTGRAEPDRVLPGQLQALICAKESLPPPSQTRSRTGLTYPRLFARYHHLCGLSGTLRESRAELRKTYGLSTQLIRPHQRSRLERFRTRAFITKHEQFDAVLKRASAFAAAGRPVLIGTDNVRDAQELADRFKHAGVSVKLLNAANEREEAEQIRDAGATGCITISTQIAGRGTDIELQAGASEAGGLHVISLQHNRSARVDRQMAGRAARQDDPGSAEHWIRLLDSPFELSGYKGQQSWALSLARLAMRAGLACLIVQFKQRLSHRLDRSQRVKHLRADVKLARDLHFSTMSRH